MISIIMGLYNAEDTIEESIESIQNQTYQDWELIICDDGSVDNGRQIVEKIAKNDKRIILISNKKNKGLNYTLNHCLEYVHGEYIARMDADDISLPTRLEKELEVIKKEKVDIVSCSMIYFDENGDWGKSSIINYPKKSDFIYGTPFCHAPCLVSTKSIKNVGGYTVDERLLRVEDYHLWYKMYLKGYRGFNIDEPLYKMRDDRSARNRRKFKYRLNESYVKLLIWKNFDYSFLSLIYVLRPIIVGVMPGCIYDILHKKKLKD